MDIPRFYYLLVPLALLLVFFNGLISKDIHDWTPSLKARIGLYLLVWLFPVAGFYLANRIGDLGWFQRKTDSGGDGVVSGGFLGIDAVFNPGARHVIEVREKQKSGLRQEYKKSDDKDKNTNRD